MASGDAKLDLDGNSILQDSGDQRLESEDNECCCGCWKKAERCICGPLIDPGSITDPNDVLYIPCDLVTVNVVFRPSQFQTVLDDVCYSVGPNSDEVTSLPDGVTEHTNIFNTAKSCQACCQIDRACCFEDGSCLNLPHAECIAQGGTPQRKGTNCADIECLISPQNCPQPKECALCGDTVAFTTTLSYQICGSSIECPGNCMENDWPVLMALGRTNCVWSSSAQLTFEGTCYNAPFSCDKVSLPEVRCEGQTWHLQVRLSVFASCNFGSTATILIKWTKPNTTNCPFGDYVFDGFSVSGNIPPDWTFEIFPTAASIG